MTDKIQFTSAEETEHSHQSAELFYVLTGNIQITVEEEIFQASPKDMVLFNAKEAHSWKSFGHALVCKIYMDMHTLKRVLKREQLSFLCNSIKKAETSYDRLRYILDSIVEKYAKEPESFGMKSLYYALWEELKTHYLTESRDACVPVSERAQEVIKYIRKYYHRPLNLTEAASHWYMSESAFSRFFKQETGANFAQFLRNVRLEHAKEELLATNKSITEIAYDCGFSNISVFNKSFKRAFLISPKEFRREREHNGIGMEINPKEKSSLDMYLKSEARYGNEEKLDQEQITIDTASGRPWNNTVLDCLCLGMLSDLMEAKVQRHVSMVVQELGIRYIRVFNPFSPRLKIRNGHETGQMNFEKMDMILDFLLEQGVIPVLELTERRKKIIVNIDLNEELKEEESDPVFLSVEEWECALTMLLQHLTERYTLQEVNKWVFEVWYDVENETGAGKIPYMVLYAGTWSIIKKYAPKARIGGSGLNADISRGILKQQLAWWKDRKDRPDHLTFISYPYMVSCNSKEEKGRRYRLLSVDTDTHFVKRDLDEYELMLQETGYPKTPVWITEWNTSLSERNIYNDSCAKACHMLTQMTDAADRTGQMCYSSISDCPFQYFDSTAPLTGATGLITKDALPKPAYHAFAFWKQLGNRLLGKGEHYIAASQNEESIQILAFHAKKFSFSYYQKREDQLKLEDLPYIFQDTKECRLSFTLRSVKSGRKKIYVQRVSESCGSILGEWKKLGYEQNLLRFETAYLKKICIPRMEVFYQEVKDGKLEFGITLKANEMAFIQIL